MQMQESERQYQKAPARQNGDNGFTDSVIEIDLVELLFRCLASWKLIVALVLLSTVVAGLLTNYNVTPLYKATSTIYIVGSKDALINMSDLTVSSALASDYLRVFQMWEMHAEVAKESGMDYDYLELMDMVSVSNPTSTHMIDITVTSDNPEEAATLANQYAKISCRYISEIMSTERPNIVSAALTPYEPFNLSSRSKNCAIGFVCGMMLAFGIVFIRLVLDDKIKTAEDISKYTGLVNLAIIPVVESEKSMRSHPKNSGRDKKRK